MTSEQVEIIGKRPSDAARLAIVLRQTQWELDRVAFNLPEGRVTQHEREQLADALVTLAGLLRSAD